MYVRNNQWYSYRIDFVIWKRQPASDSTSACLPRHTNDKCIFLVNYILYICHFQWPATESRLIWHRVLAKRRTYTPTYIFRRYICVTFLHSSKRLVCISKLDHRVIIVREISIHVLIKLSIKTFSPTRVTRTYKFPKRSALRNSLRKLNTNKGKPNSSVSLPIYLHLKNRELLRPSLVTLVAALPQLFPPRFPHAYIRPSS